MRTLVLIALAIGCKARPTPVPQETPAIPPVVAAPVGMAAGVEDPALADLLTRHWNGTMEVSPMWASQLGDHRFDDRAGDSSKAADDALLKRQRGWVAEAEAMSGLSPADAITRDQFVGRLNGEIGQAVCRFGDWSISARNNPMVEANGEGEMAKLTTVQSGTDLVKRYNAMAADIQVRTERIRTGAVGGRVANRTSVEKVLEQLADQLEAPVAEWPLLQPLERVPESWPTERKRIFEIRLTQASEAIIQSLKGWKTMLETDVLPNARTEKVGLVGIPDGAACYAATIENYTTLPLTPDEVHQTGLDEIARLHSELGDLGERALQTRDVQTIFKKLRTEPTLYFETEQEVEDKANEALKRAKAAIPTYFGNLPESDCEVLRVPDYEAPYTTIAYYRQTIPGERPGAYFVNTYKPQTRPRHEAEVLAFHESIPGHHLQIALAREAGELPLFRRHFAATAFVEGWALYTEQLADEMGLYSGDTDRLGMYSFELWRAARLVVDTGIHHKGWSRQQAVDFMVENTPLAENNIVNEVDRYITWPGQALAYKTGQLEIWKLRREAEAELGESFDLKGFHDVVLASGAVDLVTLRRQVEDWVNRAKN